MSLPSLPRAVTFLPSIVWEAVIRLRNGLYDRGLLPTERISAPVIRIGNITLGGTGKTPLAILVAQLLAEFGAVPALLSRGYGRREGPATLVVRPEVSVDDSPARLGDEPALLRRRVPSLWVGIDATRARAARAILQSEPRAAFVLDDGFQHRKLSRTLDIVVVDQSQPFERNSLVPRGTLREPIDGLGRADAIVLSGRRGLHDVDSITRAVRQAARRRPVFHLAPAITAIVPYDRWVRGPSTAESVRPRRAFLAAAIGNPSRFRTDVEDLGIEVSGELLLRDHVKIPPPQWENCWRLAARQGADWILTTEKDAIKAGPPPGFPLAVCVQVPRIEEDEQFAGLIRQAAGGRP